MHVSCPLRVVIMALPLSLPPADLPPFLTSIIDGLTNYMKWCDMHLQNPQNSRPGVKENLSRQRENLGMQMQLVNNQITLYRVRGEV